MRVDYFGPKVIVVYTLREAMVTSAAFSNLRLLVPHCCRFELHV